MSSGYCVQVRVQQSYSRHCTATHSTQKARCAQPQHRHFCKSTCGQSTKKAAATCALPLPLPLQMLCALKNIQNDCPSQMESKITDCASNEHWDCPFSTILLEYSLPLAPKHMQTSQLSSIQNFRILFPFSWLYLPLHYLANIVSPMCSS
jgi:hypothetical protein